MIKLSLQWDKKPMGGGNNDKTTLMPKANLF